MRHITVIAGCIALNIIYARLAGAGEQVQIGSTVRIQDSARSEDELHFVGVLIFQGEIIAVDPAKRLVTLKDPKGKILTLEARSEEDLAARKVGQHVLVRYFEGASVEKSGAGKVAAVHSLNDGLIGAELNGPAGKHHALTASVERVDAAEQEIALKVPDGSLETIMVANPKYLRHVNVGDRVVIKGAQALALSFEKRADKGGSLAL